MDHIEINYCKPKPNRKETKYTHSNLQCIKCRKFKPNLYLFNSGIYCKVCYPNTDVKRFKGSKIGMH